MECRTLRSYRRALITGGSSGIGRAFAAQLPATTDLLITGRDEQRLLEAAAELARPGRAVETITADLAEQGGRDLVVERAEAFGIDLLIDNAGSARFGRFLDGTPEAEREMAQVNVVAVVDLTRRLLPGMLERARASGSRAGLIVISSTAAFAPVPFFATYAATKAFDLHFAEALAFELGSEPIDVLALCPGLTQSNLTRNLGLPAAALTGAGDPRAVAAHGLAALGQRTVQVTGLINQVALRPVVLPRRLVNGAVGFAMRLVAGGAR